MKIDSRFNFWLNFETKWMKAHPYHGRRSVDCEIASNLLFCIMNTNKRWWEYGTSKKEERHESRKRNESRRFYLLIRYVCWFSILMRMLLCRSNELFGVIHQIPLAYKCATNQNDSIHYAYTFFGDILWHSLPPFFTRFPFLVHFESGFFSLFFSFFSRFLSFFSRFFLVFSPALFSLRNQTKWTFFHFEFRQNGHFIFSVGKKIWMSKKFQSISERCIIQALLFMKHMNMFVHTSYITGIVSHHMGKPDIHHPTCNRFIFPNIAAWIQLCIVEITWNIHCTPVQ